MCVRSGGKKNFKKNMKKEEPQKQRIPTLAGGSASSRRERLHCQQCRSPKIRERRCGKGPFGQLKMFHKIDEEATMDSDLGAGKKKKQAR